MTYTINVLPNGVKLETEQGSNLLEVLRNAGLSPEAPCGGHGTCKKCMVTVNGEKQLSCQTAVECDMTVELPVKQDTNILVGGDGVKVEMKPVREGYLIAFDIGTTTVVCYLLDPETGKELANASMLNPQSPFGADVISRMQLALAGEMDKLVCAIREGMTSLIEEACGKAGISPSQVGVVSVVGNPCMQQLFMGISPKNLAEIPFGPVIVKAEVKECAEYLPVCSGAALLVVPDVSGYVGGDTMGCVVSTRMYMDEKKVLMVDIGTNGEMVLGNKERMTACSTAAGPALEGARIKFGMRGAPGAIDHVWVEDGEIKCSTIGGGKAIGICGSGLIDAVAVALDEKLINKRGRIASADTIDGSRYIRLTDEVYLTQDDIREVQLAKGSIAAGITLMANYLGYTVNDIDEVQLAGAFGNFMRPESACRIGLLPAELNGKVKGIGNAAGAGSKMMASNEDELWNTEELIRKIEFIELASIPEFQLTFAKCMGFTE